jgi:RNA polymerase sigma factor (TIGR02999 family)
VQQDDLAFTCRPADRPIRSSCDIDAIRRANPTFGAAQLRLNGLLLLLLQGMYTEINGLPRCTPMEVLNQLTELLGRVQAGEAGAREALFASAYPDLRRLARARLREGRRNTLLDTTCLVHEAYLRFLQGGKLRAEDRLTFFAYASHVMRSVIVTYVRKRLAQKRGGSWRPLTLSTHVALGVVDGEEAILRVHEALEALETAEPRLASVVEMRYFGGYSEREIAETLEITERTVQRDWEKARVMLAAMLE